MDDNLLGHLLNALDPQEQQRVELDLRWHAEARQGLELLETRGPGPLDMAQGEERRERVRASVDQLPDFLRQVVILAYYQGLKYREIADILGIPVGTVKSRLHAALTKLNEAWTAQPSLLG